MAHRGPGLPDCLRMVLTRAGSATAASRGCASQSSWLGSATGLAPRCWDGRRRPGRHHRRRSSRYKGHRVLRDAHCWAHAAAAPGAASARAGARANAAVAPSAFDGRPGATADRADWQRLAEPPIAADPGGRCRSTAAACDARSRSRRGSVWVFGAGHDGPGHRAKCWRRCRAVSSGSTPTPIPAGASWREHGRRRPGAGHRRIRGNSPPDVLVLEIRMRFDFDITLALSVATTWLHRRDRFGHESRYISQTPGARGQSGCR